MEHSPNSELGKTTQTLRNFVLWQGGIKFGLPMAALLLAHNIGRDTSSYFPSLPLTGKFIFVWAWGLIVSPVVFFGIGCLFGLSMWYVTKALKRRSGSGDEVPGR